MNAELVKRMNPYISDIIRLSIEQDLPISIGSKYIQELMQCKNEVEAMKYIETLKKRYYETV